MGIGKREDDLEAARDGVASHRRVVLPPVVRGRHQLQPIITERYPARAAVARRSATPNQCTCHTSRVSVGIALSPAWEAPVRVRGTRIVEHDDTKQVTVPPEVLVVLFDGLTNVALCTAMTSSPTLRHEISVARGDHSSQLR
jgi:hypothetical protein